MQPHFNGVGVAYRLLEGELTKESLAMTRSMMRLRHLDTAVPPSDVREVDLSKLVAELKKMRIDLSKYSGGFADVAFELAVEDTFVAQIASSFIQGQEPSFGSRMLLEHAPLDADHWRLSDGTVVDLSQNPELLAKARLVERVRSACRMRVAC